LIQGRPVASAQRITRFQQTTARQRHGLYTMLAARIIYSTSAMLLGGLISSVTRNSLGVCFHLQVALRTVKPRTIQLTMTYARIRTMSAVDQ